MDNLKNINRNIQNIQEKQINTYKLLEENIVECIWLLDLKDNRFLYVSPSVFNLRGYTVEEAMNHTLEKCMTPESAENMRKHAIERLPKYLSGDRSESVVSGIGEYQLYHKNGTIITVEATTKLLFNEETNSINLLGVLRDITERKKLEQKLKDELNSLINSENIQSNTETGKYKIYCFGKFTIYGEDNNTPIKWRTSKSEELFAFLLQYKNAELPKGKICDALWPESNTKQVDINLHTSIYKMKKSLSEAGIRIDMKFKNGSYTTYLPNIYSDVDEFIKITENKLLQINESDEQTIKQYKTAFSLYRDDYMDGNDYIWALPKREYYRDRFYSIAKVLANYYLSHQDYSSAKKTILKMLDNNNLDEDSHELLLKLFILQKDRCSFINHYERMKEMLFTELGITPKESVKLLYKNFYYSNL